MRKTYGDQTTASPFRQSRKRHEPAPESTPKQARTLPLLPVLQRLVESGELSTHGTVISEHIDDADMSYLDDLLPRSEALPEVCRNHIPQKLPTA